MALLDAKRIVRGATGYTTAKLTAGHGVLYAELPERFGAGAIRLEHQAQFHPRRFLLPVAATLPGDGSSVYENTIAIRVKEGDPCEVETDRGQVRAREVLVATQLPFLERGL